VNVKLGRVGGFSEAIRVHDVALAAEIPVWCGGMLESGIGRAHNLALSTLIGFSLPAIYRHRRVTGRKISLSRRLQFQPKAQLRSRMKRGVGIQYGRNSSNG